MTTSSISKSAPTVGRFTGLVLGLVVFVCVTLIACAVFLKYELDRAEMVLAAPESVLSADQDTFEKLRRSLGFSGFVGRAQSFSASRDEALLADMKLEEQSASDIVAHLPENTPADSRRDLQAILGVFEAALQKANKAASDAALSFGSGEMAPLYATLPVLDARVASATSSIRLAAQGQLQFWATLLMVISWVSLIIASALAATIYLTLRDRNSAPMRALAQSVKNMARGDMRTSIWGMERQDVVGELARAVDIARFQFSQMPDLSVMSEQGPVRLRFEGNTRSLFEAMMRVISQDSEQVHQQAASLTEAINRQHEAIVGLTGRVEGVMHNVEHQTMIGDQQTRQALQNILSSAQHLEHAQEHAADQLGRIVPYLQERAHGLTEITQITGKQVSQVLQSLTLAERSLTNSAEQSESAIRKFSSTADDLGERMFGAVNLLQASGKVLAETTETTQSRLNEAIEQLTANVQAAGQPPMGGETGQTDDFGAGTVPRLETAANTLEAMQRKLEVLLSEQEQATRAQIDLLTTHSNGLLSQSTTASQTLSHATDHMHGSQAKLDDAFGHFAAKLDELGSRLDAQATAALDRTMVAADKNNGHLKELAGHIVALSEKLTALGQEMRQPVFAAPNPDLSDQVREHWFQMAGQLEATRAGLAHIIAEQISRIDSRLADIGVMPGIESENGHDTQHQMEQQTQVLTELVATLGVLDAHMQEIRSQVSELRLKAG